MEENQGIASSKLEVSICEREHAVQAKESALARAAGAARAEVLAVRREKETLGIDLKQARKHIEELRQQCGILSERLQGTLSQMAASATAVTKGENSARMMALQMELTANKEKAKDAVTWSDRQCANLQASSSNGALRPGRVASDRYLLATPDGSDLLPMADMKHALEQQIELLKDQLSTVCQSNACGSADEVLELLKQYKSIEEKHRAACAQLSLQHNKVKDFEYNSQKSQKNFMELREKLMQIYRAVDGERQMISLDSIPEQDSRILLAPEYVENLALKAEAEADSAEMSRCLGESWRHCSDLECQVAVLKHEHAWCHVENAFMSAQVEELRLNLLSLNERLHEREAQLVSVQDELQLKDQSLHMANDNLHRSNEQSEVYKKEICWLKHRVEELEGVESECYQMHSRVQDRAIAGMQEIQQTHQMPAESEYSDDGGTSQPSDDAQNCFSGVAASMATRGLDRAPNNESVGLGFWRRRWVQVATTKVAALTLVLVLWKVGCGEGASPQAARNKKWRE